MGSWGRENMQQGYGWRTWQAGRHRLAEGSLICVQINQEEQLGSKGSRNQGSSTGKESLKTSGFKNL